MKCILNTVSTILLKLYITETYEELWKWSVTHYVDFWEMFWKYTDIVHSQPYKEVLQLAIRQLIYIFFSYQRKYIIECVVPGNIHAHPKEG